MVAVLGPPAETITVSPAIASGAFVDVGNWWR